MSIFSWIDHEAKVTVAALVPAALRAELGDLGHAIVSNIVYDAKALGLKLEQITADDIEVIWNTVKQVATAMGPQLLAEAFSGNIGKAVASLGSAEVKAVLPQLKMVGQSTLTTMMTTAASMVVSGVLTAAVAPTSAPSPAPSVKPGA